MKISHLKFSLGSGPSTGYVVGKAFSYGGGGVGGGGANGDAFGYGGSEGFDEDGSGPVSNGAGFRNGSGAGSGAGSGYWKGKG